jgi:hypothetical protein
MSATTNARCTLRHGAGVVNHGIQRDRDRRVQSQDHLSEGVAHKQDVYPGSIQQPGHRGIVGCQHDDSFAALLHESKIRHADFLEDPDH